MRYNKELSKFRRWFMREGPRFGEVPWHNAVTDIHGVVGIQWYRKPPFQVQLFIATVPYIIPEHVHPNVDSYELMIGGKFLPSREGKWVTSPERLAIAEAGEVNPYQGKVVLVLSDTVHGALIGEGGATFMSIQHWKNGVEPHCIGRDYDGTALAEDHHTVAGTTNYKGELTWRDAASKEDAPPSWYR